MVIFDDFKPQYRLHDFNILAKYVFFFKVRFFFFVSSVFVCKQKS